MFNPRPTCIKCVRHSLVSIKFAIGDTLALENHFSKNCGLFIVLLHTAHIVICAF